MKNHLSQYPKYLLLLALLAVPLFGHMDTLAIRIWDEARMAMNAYEMFKNGDFIVTHYGGEPDMWNTKPPLLIWLQALLMQVVGVNEIAVRLPSAIAAFLTCIALLVFAQRYLQRFWFGFIAVLALVTTQGYIELHAVRTGDYDALLTLFTTLSGLCFFAFCETQRYRWLYLFFLSTSLAVLTKGVAGLFFLPGIALYSLLQGQVVPLLRSRHFYLGLAGFLLIALGYYFLREAYNPGYIAAVYENELGGRYFHVIENHSMDTWFYYRLLMDSTLGSWQLFVPCGLALGLFVRDQKIKRLAVFSALSLFTYLLVISGAQTKLGWYAVPLYPFTALLVAVFAHYVFQVIEEADWARGSLQYNIAPFVFLFLIGVGPYRAILAKTYLPQEPPAEAAFYEIGHYLKDAIRGVHDLQGQYLLYDGYHAHNLFYLKALDEKGIDVFIRPWRDIEAGMVVFTYQDHIKQHIDTHFVAEVLATHGQVTTYKLNAHR